MDKPFDERLIKMMDAVGDALCQEITGARLAYLQSDEISIVIYNEIGQEPWFDNKIVKMTSISAAIASATAIKWKQKNNFYPDEVISFDSRVFVIPEFEISNYFIWRQKD
jgi:tRNA(His) 5'-end guanylyltransferase